MVKFYFDCIVDGKPYPNLARHQASPYTPEWREFSKNWPFSEPLHFLEYLDQESIEYQLVTTPENAVYPVSVSFFDFGVNWFELIDSATIDAFRAKTCKLWFFYSEGDNPVRIQRHLKTQAIKHYIPLEQIHFTSANSSAKNLENFSHFVDDELLYRLRNEDSPCEFHTRRRRKKFTALVRTHKWWRATTMARLWQQNLHEIGYFSYNTDLDVGEQPTDNPIEIDSFPGLRQDTLQFIKNGPYHADTLDSNTHNLYSTTVKDHFEDSYLNLVLETHLDADQSGGTFLTEKTFKPIKHAQLFLIVGPQHSIKQLKKMGYRTFDHIINHSYDNIKNNTDRWHAVMQEAEKLIMHEHLYSLYTECEDDLRHNQELFLRSKANRLNTLMRKLTQ